MQNSAIDEREHRRGLILGLTLAEALLLLLFLLMLAFAARIDTLQGENQKVRNVLDRMKSASMPQTPQDVASGLKYVTELETRVDELEAGNAKLIEIVTALKSDPSKMVAMQGVVAQAQKINPDDPPAVLQRALRILDVVGPSADPDQVKSAMTSYLRGKGGSLSASGGKHNWPPIITLSEADGHFFESGSAELSSEFQAALSGSVLVRLLEIIKQYEVNVVEVIGHTDEQHLSGERVSNLDKTLVPSLQPKSTSEPFVASDNAGLGLARAAAVVRLLSRDERLAGIRILPFSGAQAIDVNDRLATGESAGAVKERRRIEIRIRRSEK